MLHQPQIAARHDLFLRLSTHIDSDDLAILNTFPKLYGERTAIWTKPGQQAPFWRGFLHLDVTDFQIAGVQYDFYCLRIGD